MKHLIITTAHIPKESCLIKIGYDYQIRVQDYIESFKSALKLSNKFDSIKIIETVSKEKIDYLENSGIDVYYSTFDNSFINKGLNEMYHIKNFLDNNEIYADDMIVKLSGRYIIVNDNILNLDSDFIAKFDGDIYDPFNRGVHTFYFAFKKSLFLEFINWLNIENTNNDYTPIEWKVKEFLLVKNIKILDNSYKIGVITCLFSKELNRWTKVYC